MRRWLICAVGVILAAGLAAGGAHAQRARKPQRAQPPKFTGKEFAGTFFENVASVLQGQPPSAQAAVAAVANGASAAAPANVPGAPAAASPAGSAAAGSGDGWAKLISAATIEDVVKNSKLRLDQLVASPTKFAGGYVDARREFSLQALMFAIIEQYSGEVRWKHSAAVARESLARMAANAKVSSPQAYKEAKQRVLDLEELLNGSSLSGSASSEVVWADVIDRVPLMQLLEWAQQQHINTYASSKENFEEHKEELQRYAELVATLGKAAIMEDMPDAADADYRGLAQQMIEQAGQIVLAVQTDNADLARQAAGQVGQACAKCHDGYR
jgi:cytochrome c556